jgi:hypothetical protein
MLRSIVEWIAPRLVMAVVIVIVGVAALRVSELIVPGDEPNKVVVDVPAGVCPTGLTPLSIKCEVNAIRRANGLRQLATNYRLRAAARGHARDMVGRHYFAHVSPEGRDLTNRVQKVGYLRGARDWDIGENIAWGSGAASAPKAIVEAWMRSPPHRAVILNPSYTEGGAGIVHGTPNGAPGETYVMDLGKRSTRSSSSGWENVGH